MKVNRCPACFSKRISFAFKSVSKDFSFERYDWWECLSCRTIFLNPIPTDKQIFELYSNKETNPNAYLTPEQIRTRWLQKERFERDNLQYLVPLLKYKRNGKLLDFGCGCGWFVHHASLKGFDAIGIDINATVINSGKKVFQGDLFQGSFQKLNEFKTGSFDVVSCFSIFEHLQNPSAFLIQIFRLLKPDGIFMAEIPLVDSLQFKMFKQFFYWCMAPYHINLFSLEGLNKLFSRSGFSILLRKGIENNWYWTKAIVDKLGLQYEYKTWRNMPKFVQFDIEVDQIFDRIAHESAMQSAVLVLAKKKTKSFREPSSFART